jgi:protein-tyrosine-phosphatase/isopentenyldiphosphate isomerase
VKPKIKLHFVCRGNVHRSRLAEAIARSKLDDTWEVSSSGVDAAVLYPKHYLSPWAKILSNEYGLNDYMSSHRTQTTTEILTDKDIIVFMNQDVYDDAVARYSFNTAKCLVWHVKDREDWNNTYSLRDKRQKTYRTIAKNVNALLQNITRGGWVDAVDEHNNPLGFSLPVSVAAANAVWHRGCHAIITTPDLKTLVQKRSKNIIFSPKLVDISLGGHVDANEDPETAMIREIQEEIDIIAAKHNLKFLEIYRQASYHPKYKKYTKAFIYTYHVPLSINNPIMNIQKSEVSAVKLLSQRQLKKLLRHNRLRHFGQLNYTHEFYKRISSLAGVV